MGKTALERCQGLAKEKHPHVHGEDVDFVYNLGSAAETPPRAWGRLASSILQNGILGNTPTCMGKTVRIGMRQLCE